MDEPKPDVDLLLEIAGAIKPHTGLFALGQVVATPGAAAALGRNRQAAEQLLWRHQRGDWGDLDAHDRRVNARAVKQGSRVMSVYPLADGTVVWVITDPGWEGNEPVTTILETGEY